MMHTLFLNLFYRIIICHSFNAMAYISNSDKMLQAVLMNPQLMDYGKYTYADFSTLTQALVSDNYVINAVARIIKGLDDKSSLNEIWREVNNYLKENV